MSLKYGKPPIAEAIFDIRVEPRPGASAIEIDSAFALRRDEFPTLQEIPADNGIHVTLGANFSFVAPGGATLGGMRYVSADKRRIVQARRDAFAFSFVGTPENRYPGWDIFSTEALQLWEAYCAAWRPLRVTRIALRFVNQFPLADLTPEEIQAHLSMVPPMPRPHLMSQQTLANFSAQVVLPQTDLILPIEDSGAMAIINQGLLLAPPAAPSLLLDIDLFREGLSWETSNGEILRLAFAQFRRRKNVLFRACITDIAEAKLEPLSLEIEE